MEHRYDEYYPITTHDEVRVCAWQDPRGGPTCGRTYSQWSRAQDSEPLTNCKKHAPVWGEKKKKKRKPV